MKQAEERIQRVGGLEGGREGGKDGMAWDGPRVGNWKGQSSSDGY